MQHRLIIEKSYFISEARQDHYWEDSPGTLRQMLVKFDVCYDGQEVIVQEELSGTSVKDTEMDGDIIIVDGLGSEGIQHQCPPPSSTDPLAVCGKRTLFNKPLHSPSSQLTTIKSVHRDPATPKKNFLLIAICLY
ncbi:hypothetical protein Pcinc_032425 [Petrolisthes cinctipes]|uniref:Uncharacterized protein n=1 Tax=Petrolisthes cinctipes TaxID=88211 RepID=A0AAE1EUC5_PETCI|nr:hypothetical protein Pcinc_032425 [Petrolisthes cinctipes]